MTWADFQVQMARLDGLKFRPPSLQSHWEQMKDMPDVLIEAAITKAQGEVTEFPSPKMIKIFADQVRARVLPVPPEEDRSEPNPSPTVAIIPQTGHVLPLKRFWNYYCAECSDMGQRSFWCGQTASTRQPWLEIGHCGRRGDHGEHEWVAPCPCAATNHEVQRKLERQRQGGRRGETE